MGFIERRGGDGEEKDERERERKIKGGERERGENGRKEGEESEWSLSLKGTVYCLHDPLYQGVPEY